MYWRNEEGKESAAISNSFDEREGFCRETTDFQKLEYNGFLHGYVKVDQSRKSDNDAEALDAFLVW